MSCLFESLAIVGLPGVTAIDVKLVSVIVTLVVSDSAADVAVIIVEPEAIPLTIPSAFTVAIRVSEDDQIAELVISTEIPSE